MKKFGKAFRKNAMKNSMQNFVKNAGMAMLLLALLALTGCNTVAGVGRDIQKTGEALEKVAD